MAFFGFCGRARPGETFPSARGNWKTVYDRFRRWAEDGTLEATLRHLQGELDAEGRIDWSQFNVDSTIVQASRAASGGPLGDKKGARRGLEDPGISPALVCGRGGFSTKIHLLTDRQGLPMATVLSAGQRHEATVFTDLMNEVAVPRPRGRPRKRPEAVAGDRAYDATWIRPWRSNRGIESVIPSRSRKGPGRPPTCDEQKYKRRNAIERFVGRLKERRRLVVRYEKKASHYKAMLLWAFVREYLNQ